ncbi:phosphatase PAP2 family protein [Wenyingzhuangia sp. IMCC45574]
MEKLKQDYYIVLLVLFLSAKLTAQSTIETIGDVALYTSPAAILGVALIEKDKEGLKMYAKGFALNTVVTLGLKELIKKRRPNGEDLKSFPSGHTSATFQAAAYLQKRYGWGYGVPAYLVASYTGFSRVYSDKHFIEDTLVGASIGIVSSYLFTRKKDKNSTTIFSFQKIDNGLLFSYNYRF